MGSNKQVRGGGGYYLSDRRFGRSVMIGLRIELVRSAGIRGMYGSFGSLNGSISFMANSTLLIY
jgi:hypothetical protein